jgi:hypothetical protein
MAAVSAAVTNERGLFLDRLARGLTALGADGLVADFTLCLDDFAKPTQQLGA